VVGGPGLVIMFTLGQVCQHTGIAAFQRVQGSMPAVVALQLLIWAVRGHHTWAAALQLPVLLVGGLL
jgi:hypothetical protein